MAWPLYTDYRDLLQTPGLAFKHPDLKAGAVQADPFGLPFIRSGNFAGVCKVSNGRDYAVRCFYRTQADRHERYDIVSKHLRDWRKQQPRSAIVGFDYIEEGILFRGTWYPILKMDWVNGDTLYDWLKKQVQQRNAAAIRKVADDWVPLLLTLQAGNITHGDLQHGNVMVANQQLFLVDYDCMGVPGLFGRECLEDGVPGYQHPERGGGCLAPNLDDFSAIVILVALRAIAADLSLWKTFVDDIENDNILFQKSDVKDPDHSPLFRALASSPDSHVREWSGVLRNAALGPMKDVPPISAVTDAFGRLRKLCRAAPLDWEAIAREAAAPTITSKPLPGDLQAPVTEARTRVQARDAVAKAIDSKSVRSIVTAGKQAKLLKGWSAERMITDVQKAESLLATLEKLEALARQPARCRDLVALWDQAATQPLHGYAEADVVAKEVGTWRHRIRAVDTLLQAVKLQPVSAIKIAQAWDELQRAGGHNDADPHTPLAIKCVQQRDCIQKLAAVGPAVDETTDRKFLALWSDALLTGCEDAKHLWPRIQQVRDRLNKVAKVEATVRDVDAGRQTEDAIVQAAAGLPAGYSYSARARVQSARDRWRVLDTLERGIAAQPQSDEAIAAAWEAIEKAGAQQAAAKFHARAAEAIRRSACLKDLAAIPDSNEESTDRKFVAVWNDALLSPCHDARRFDARHAAAHKRIEILDRLEETIRRANGGLATEGEIVQAARGLDARYKHHLADRVREAAQRADSLRALELALAASPGSDLAIADAWERIQNAKAQAQVAKPHQQRAVLATQRRGRLKRIEQILAGSQADFEVDRNLIAACDEAFLADCSDAQRYSDRYRTAVRRDAVWQELEAALGRNDDLSVFRLARDPILRNYSLLAQNQGRVDECCRRAEKPVRLLDCLERNDADGFVSVFDCDTIRRYPTSFRLYAERVRLWVQQRILLHAQLSLPSGGKAFEASGSAGQYMIRWRWPRAGHINSCQVAIDRRGFPRTPDDTRHTLRVTHEAYTRASGAAVPLHGWVGPAFITVWPEMDLGYDVILGAPLNLGKFSVSAPRRSDDSDRGGGILGGILDL